MFAFRAGSNDRNLMELGKIRQTAGDFEPSPPLRHREMDHMFAGMRVCVIALAAAAAVLAILPAACKDGAPKPGTGTGSGSDTGTGTGSGSVEPHAPDAAAIPPAGSACTAETLIRVSRVLTEAHPCRARMEAAVGRLVRIGPAASGTIVS
ncbi:MAG TPA: hypothetical protein VN253_17110, partial [Kofleriaceae bacterium]|nr:hypothetical protein [Kofleriaceae bacterium]